MLQNDFQKGYKFCYLSNAPLGSVAAGGIVVCILLDRYEKSKENCNVNTSFVRATNKFSIANYAILNASYRIRHNAEQQNNKTANNNFWIEFSSLLFMHIIRSAFSASSFSIHSLHFSVSNCHHNYPTSVDFRKCCSVHRRQNEKKKKKNTQFAIVKRNRCGKTNKRNKSFSPQSIRKANEGKKNLCENIQLLLIQ